MARYPTVFASRLQFYVEQISTILDGYLGTLRLSNGSDAIAIRNADDWVGMLEAPQVLGLEVVLEPMFALAYKDFASGGLIEEPKTRITLKQWDIQKTSVIEADLLASRFSLVDRRTMVRVPRYLKSGIIDQTTMVIADFLESFH